jgi:ABC-type Fe3+/spermidine/putrescine transport system ATPase subunit
MLKISQLAVQLGAFRLLDVNLEIADGEYFVILGASGSGKTVLLETIAGRHRLARGRIDMDGEKISALLPERRNIGFVYQNYELFPHMTVGQNIAFGLRYQGVPKPRRQEKLREMMDILSVSHLKDSYPDTLSGGEKQRAALGRSLILSPKLLLLDEPLSALDYVTKQHVKESIRLIHRRFSPTVIHVTHDIEEALFFADRIGIIKAHTMARIFDARDIAGMRKGDFYAYL